MGRPTPMHLSEDERDHVQVFMRRGKANARTLTRARVLLKSDEGWTDAAIAEVLDISEQTIRKIRQRFRAGGVEAVLTDKRQERRRQALTDGQAAHLIAITCSTVADGHDHWTVRMLAGQAVELGYVRRISPETVRQLLKKTHRSPGNMSSGGFPTSMRTLWRPWRTCWTCTPSRMIPLPRRSALTKNRS